jgi:putative phosphoesterase
VVVSDSHGAWGNLFEAISREASADAVYFLGDGYREYEAASEMYSDKKAFIGVQGNCDFGCSLPTKDIRTIESAKIYATHGFVERVKYGPYDLEIAARENSCNLVFFGHTHQPTSYYKDGIHYFNPGSLRDGFYGVVDITDNGIMCIRKTLSFY